MSVVKNRRMVCNSQIHPKVHHQTLVLQNLGEGQIFGEEVLFDSQMRYFYNVTCLAQESCLYSIKAPLITKYFPKVFKQYLKELFQHKIEKYAHVLSSHEFTNAQIADNLNKISH